MIRKILAAFGYPWFLESKGRGSFVIEPPTQMPEWLSEHVAQLNRDAVAVPMSHEDRQKLAQEGLMALDCAMSRLTKKMGQDQIKRRLMNVRFQRLKKMEEIVTAIDRREKRSHLRAEMAELTNEEHRLEAML